MKGRDALDIISGSPTNKGFMLSTDTGIWIDGYLENGEVVIKTSETAIGSIREAAPGWLDYIPILRYLPGTLEFFFIKYRWLGIMLAALTVTQYLPSGSGEGSMGDIKIRIYEWQLALVVAILGAILWIFARKFGATLRFHSVEHMTANAFRSKKPATVQGLKEAGSFSVNCGSLIVINAMVVNFVMDRLIPPVYNPPLLAMIGFAAGLELRDLEMEHAVLRGAAKVMQRIVCWNPSDEELTVGVAVLEELYQIQSVEEESEGVE